jgi:hypothetical protein
MLPLNRARRRGAPRGLDGPAGSPRPPGALARLLEAAAGAHLQLYCNDRLRQGARGKDLEPVGGEAGTSSPLPDRGVIAGRPSSGRLGPSNGPIPSGRPCRRPCGHRPSGRRLCARRRPCELRSSARPSGRRTSCDPRGGPPAWQALSLDGPDAAWAGVPPLPTSWRRPPPPLRPPSLSRQRRRPPARLGRFRRVPRRRLPCRCRIRLPCCPFRERALLAARPRGPFRASPRPASLDEPVP